MAENFGSLSTYVDQHSQGIIAKLNWESDSLRLFQKMDGVTNSAAINYFEIDPILKESLTCTAMSATGATNLYQKNVSVCMFKAEDSWCKQSFQKYWFTEMERMKGVGNDNIGSLEEKFVQELTIRLMKQLEVKAWRGTDTCQGIFHQLSGDSARVTTGTTAITVSNIQAQIILMINNMNIDIQQQDDLYLFVSPAIHYLFMQSMFSANNYGMPLIKYDKSGDIIVDWFGPKITLHKTFGLTGTNYMILTPLKNLYHAFDGKGKEESIELWYERRDDIMYYRNMYRFGVTYWLAEYTVCNF